MFKRLQYTKRAISTIQTRYNSISLGKYNDKYISVVINDNHTLEYSSVFLRDACNLPQSVDPLSQQKLFTTGEVARNLKLNGPPTVVDNVLHVEWNENGQVHKSQYSMAFLKKYSNTTSRRRGKFFEHERVSWNLLIGEKFPDLVTSYNNYLKKDADFYKSITSLSKYGVSFVEDIPDPSSIGEMSEGNASQWPIFDLANRFGYIKKTFYGTLFDVKNKKDATNIAYTKSFLPLHMDLLYYESPPGLQLLHAIKNSTIGGENIFVDSFRAAEHVREVDPPAYLALTQIPIAYHYDNAGEYYYFSRPLIIEEEDIIDFRTNLPVIKEVNYSPPFQAPFEVGITTNNSIQNSDNPDILYTSAKENGAHFVFKDFIRGITLFEDYINDPKNQFEIKLKEGTCVIFDNRRVLHSRNAFSDSNNGDRWLMGCYVDGDSFRSKLRVRSRNLGEYYSKKV